jgi:uncharacterized protein
MSQVPFNPYGQSGGYPMDYSDAQATSQAVGRFFNSVYAWMCAGLAVTALVAWYVATNTQILLHIGGGGLIGLFVVELLLVGVISAAVQRINAAMATVLFLVYAALNGITLSGIFLVYAQASLASAFAISAGMFGAMSLYGFVTGRDLSGWGQFLFMALIGLVIATIVSMFFHNSAFNTLVNYVGVFIFVGLTAYDTQMLKRIAVATAGNGALAARLSVSGALSLYLDFLNLFLFLLRIMGDRK